MDHDDQRSTEQPRLPEFRIADPSTWRGNPDFDPVDALLAMPNHRDSIFWAPQVGTTEELPSAAALADRVAGLGDNCFGVLKRRASSRTRFAQTLRIGERWIVEVHDGTDGDWASRVVRGRRTAPAGVLDATESWIAGEAAEVMWAWLHGALPWGVRRERLR